MSNVQPLRSRFVHLGDWLIARCDNIVAGFQMNVCINIMRTEGNRDGWLYQLTDDDINRILARYKEHVTFWNARVNAIEFELQSFADVANRSYYDIVQKYNSLQPKRFPVEYIYSHALVRKEIVTPNPNISGQNSWRADPLTDNDLRNIANSAIYGSQITQVTRQVQQWNCQVDGTFTRAQLEQSLARVAPNYWPNVSSYGGQSIRYVILNAWF